MSELLRIERRCALGVDAWAVFSGEPRVNPTDGAGARYRYTLGRRWHFAETPRGHVLWIMLNPSTADARVDDPTIRKCIGFSTRWGFGSLEVVNLYAWRATDPRDLFGYRVGDQRDEVVGPDNDWTIRNVIPYASEIVIAWGSHGARWRGRRAGSVLDMLAERPGGVRVVHIGPSTRDGQPSHPLYLPYELERMEADLS